MYLFGFLLIKYTELASYLASCSAGARWQACQAWRQAHHWHCSHPQNHVIILRLARRHPPCPLCSRPAACPPPWGGRPACPGWRWWTGAGKRSLRRCWWRASGPSRLWRSPPAPPWRREGRKRRERGLRSKVKRLMPRSVCMAQSAACGGRNNAPPVDTCAY